MTMPKMWVEKGPKDDEKPMPYLKIREDMAVIAVDSDGVRIATITSGKQVIVGYCRGAKETIEAAGYSTSWAKWSDTGRFVRLKGDGE